MCCFPVWCTSLQLMSWKIFLNFLKYFLAYCMGYDRSVDVSRYVHGKSNREQLGTQQTNLTRRKKMGFDLYSLGNHKTETGEYYRQSVWGWRRLADFVCEQTGVIAEDNKKFWQSNDGHEVSEGEAKEIAKQLKALVKDGTVSKAIREVEEESEQAEKNNKFVEICHKMLREKVERETGKTNTAPADYPKEDHDTWNGYNASIVTGVRTLLQWNRWKVSLSSANNQTVSVYVELIQKAWANAHAHAHAVWRGLCTN